jgi:uncharacterized protein YcnI
MAFLRSLVLAGAVLTAGGASAHVAADPGTAVAGGYQAVRFRVGHGCTDKAITTALRIEVPDAVISAKAQPKPGWTLTIDRAFDATGRVTAVTWRGVLASDQFDEFALFLHLPEQGGTLYFPAVQTCSTGEARWDELPAADGARRQHPAPSLRLTPAETPEKAPDAGHHH